MHIDWWTLGIQTVNVLILIWLLQRFFWKPVSAMIEQRRVAAQKALDDAEAKSKSATEALADIAKTRAGFAAERDAILKTARDDAEKARTAGADADAKQAAALKAAADAEIESQKTAASAAWAGKSSALAVQIAGRLAARLDGPAVSAAFLAWLMAELRKQPDDVRQAVGTELGIVSATPLDAAAQAQYGTAIGEALGIDPHITFSIDPSLIAGLELRSPHLVLSNSWQADLAVIEKDLLHA
jgi:F-type H+-transporting ATPase subunit b